MSNETMSRTQVRRLFAAGASVRAVMVDANITQRQVAEASGWPQARVAMILAGQTGATETGRGTSMIVFATVAKLLGVKLADIPAARALTQPKEA